MFILLNKLLLLPFIIKLTANYLLSGVNDSYFPDYSVLF